MKIQHKAGLISFALLALLAAPLSRAFAMKVETVDIPMRDGVVLKADVYLPDGDGPFPTILQRTPYDRKGLKGDGEKMVKEGFAMVGVDVRGRLASGGEWDPFFNEGVDGVDTVNWVAKQPWCSGKIATRGGSYLGITQWGMNSEPTEGLAAIEPVVAASNMYDVIYQGGAFNVATGYGWGYIMRKSKNAKPEEALLVQTAFKHLPLIDVDNKAGEQVDYLDAWVSHPAYDDYWARSDFSNVFDREDTPMLLIGGWYDMFIGPELSDFEALQARGLTKRDGGVVRIIIGPWDHSGGLVSPMMKVADENHSSKLEPLRIAWYKHWLLGDDNEAARLAPVRLFVMGANRWEEFDQWPPAGVVEQQWNLHSNGKALTLDDGAALSTDAPGAAEPADAYVYDPADPTPSKGGNILAIDLGPRDYAEVEKRDDTLVYTSAPLEAPLEIIGRVKMALYASTSACGTDFVARLLDVPPEGPALPLAEGIFRTQVVAKEPVEPGVPARFDIDMWATAFRFEPGHRIRVHVASAAFPHWDRNLNGCDDVNAKQKKTIKATQTIYHDAEHPSHIVLPVYPIK